MKRIGLKKKIAKSEIMGSKKSEIIIYQSGEKQIEVILESDTVWLTIYQIAMLFNKSRNNINEHILNIFNEGELESKQVMRKVGISDFSAIRTKPTNIYNLDVIISVGYRVKSRQGTHFRIWATQRLKDYLIKGYAINERKLIKSSEKIQQLEYLIETIKESRVEGRLKTEDTDTILNLISSYTKTFTIFNEVDSDSLKRENLNTNIIYDIDYDDVMEIVTEFKEEIIKRGESTPGFGLEADNKLKSVIGAIPQTFAGKYLYPSIEEQAANLLYMIIEGHAFRDGNKRNGSLLFVWFLEKNNYRFKNSGELKINDNALILLGLLIAKSKGQDKEFYIDLIINLISDKGKAPKHAKGYKFEERLY